MINMLTYLPYKLITTQTKTIFKCILYAINFKSKLTLTNSCAVSLCVKERKGRVLLYYAFSENQKKIKFEGLNLVFKMG